MPWIKLGFAVLLLGYPLVVYLGLEYFSVSATSLVLCLLLLMRIWVQKQPMGQLLIPLILGVALTGGSFIAKRHEWLLYYPVVINTTMLALFAFSLIKGPSMVERLARIKHLDLPKSATPYLNKVTLLWCLLFIINGTMAVYTALFTSLTTWTLYNGLIAYLLIGLLFGGEWVYRSFWLKKL